MTMHSTTSELARPETAVPSKYVHKTAHSEVLLTSWHKRSADEYTVTAQWPRTHGFYRLAHQLYDPMLFAETVRQAIPLLSHVAYDVPFGYHLIWEHFSYGLALENLRSSAGPAELVLHISCTGIERRRANLAAMTLQLRAERDGRHLGTAEARFTSHSPAVYRRLRGVHSELNSALAMARPPEKAILAHLAGRRLSEDVVLAPGGRSNCWQLRVDTEHPALFDHPVDHVPGMLILEAARQAAQAARTPVPVVVVGMETKFHRYLELDAPCWIQLFPAARPDRLRFAVEQDNTLCTSGEMSLSTPDETAPSTTTEAALPKSGEAALPTPVEAARRPFFSAQRTYGSPAPEIPRPAATCEVSAPCGAEWNSPAT
ncbi:ScbA/BarX family gamma-butyrolactone biosynthesis protein [Streptomyces sp. A5-4]|uniref:ScbA/BarX family gamma-butyrolactone biosynthesis protein n=1 Tax=Streptomyces sp. A5-4 TaxID=3384771 RepID=UPI003DA94D56